MLLQAGRYSAAYYLAGYAIELGIKARIASVFQADMIPEKSFVNAVYSHKLDDLVGLAGSSSNSWTTWGGIRSFRRRGALRASGMKRVDTRCGISSQLLACLRQWVTRTTE